MIKSKRVTGRSEGSYLLRFLGFALAFGLCGAGGVWSILRSTSFSLGVGSVFAGVNFSAFMSGRLFLSACCFGGDFVLVMAGRVRYG